MQPSGYASRWNSNGVFMLYTSSSIALASLENVVHRSGEGLNQNFRCIEITIPDKLKVDEILIKDLPKQWFQYENYRICQKIGDKWIEGGTSAILKVPSAIIKREANFLINPKHKDFRRIKIKGVDAFEFDPRLSRK